MKNKYAIYVDDERAIPKVWQIAYGENVILCCTYRQAINALQTYPKIGRTLISLDHDLGEEKTGYDIAKYIVENKIPLTGFFCHSFNPVGKMNIIQLLTHYGYLLGGEV